MGAFDNTSSKVYNGTIPPKEPDGVYFMPADTESCKNCMYKGYVKLGTDEEPDGCIFEGCIKRLLNSIKYHKNIVLKCSLCDQTFHADADDVDILITNPKQFFCPDCMDKLKKLVKGDENEQR